MPARPLPPSVEQARERLAECGTVRVRAMFGGHGFYLDGLFVALEAEGRLYLKADALTAGAFEQAGGERFVYDPGNGRPTMRMAYWTVPDEALEQAGGLRPWAQQALQAAVRARAVKRPARRAR